MELFREDGCLTDEGLLAVTKGGLDELGRLETAEHLSYCDRCMDRYTALLTAALCMLYAISDEVHQYFVPSRAMLLSDVGIDVFGAPDKPCGVGRADANPKLLLNDT